MFGWEEDHANGDKMREGMSVEETERMLRTLLGNLPGMAYRCTNQDDWAMEFVSEGSVDLTGYPPEVLMGAGPPYYGDLIHADDREGVWAAVQEAVDSGNPFVLEYRLITAQGDERWVWERGRAVDIAEDGVAILEGFITDITDRVRLAAENDQLEAEYRHSQKMEAIGRLAGGVAHDFNNLLTVINSYSALAMDEMRDCDRVRKDLRQVLRAGERAAELTSQLLTFSRRQVSEPKILDLSQVVSGVEKMLRRLIGTDVSLHISLAAEALHVRADPGQLEQVLMNLAVNARDAMPGGGQLTISTHSMDAMTVLRVSDDGEGMSDAVRERALEPFFTTKAPGQGTGLGLATVYGVVKQAGGTVHLQSTPGAGTTFDVLLPRVEEEESVGAASPPREEHRGTGTLLVAEDEPSVRELLERILEEAGYVVHSAATPAEALRIFTTHECEIDGLITDIIMPGMNGGQLAGRLRTLRPALPILYISGHAGDLGGPLGVDPGTPDLLTKPFTADRLLSEVRRVLHAGETQRSG